VASSCSTNESITVIFYTATQSGFQGADAATPLSVSVSGSFANGTFFRYSLLAGANDSAVLTSCDKGGGASGVWGSTGASFLSSCDMKTYQILLDNDEFGIKGTVMFKSVCLPTH
jgi:hypothetical protein